METIAQQWKKPSSEEELYFQKKEVERRKQKENQHGHQPMMHTTSKEKHAQEWQKPSDNEELYFQKKEVERRKQKENQHGHQPMMHATSIKERIVIAVLKEAMPMLTLDPTRAEMKWIQKVLRDFFGAETASSKEVWSDYITKREGTSNKFHYFVVLNNQGKFHAANAYGRIGYPARIADLGTFDNEHEALKVAKAKYYKKLDSGYKVTEV